MSWNTSFGTCYRIKYNVKYERNFIDVDTMGDGYQQIPLGFDIIHFGIFYGWNNIVIHHNKECAAGSFFVPFLPCQAKEELIERIDHFIKYLGDNLGDNLEEKVFVYRYIDKSGNRFFAIGSTNLKKKHKLIHELNIKTNLTDPVSPSFEDSWAAAILEMDNPVEQIYCCQIQKEEILEFESRKVALKEECSEVLIMLPKNEGFLAEHFVGKTDNSFYNAEDGAGSVFKLKSIRFQSMEELDKSIQWLMEAFRSLLGHTATKTVILYCQNQVGFIDASLICSIPGALSSKKSEDDDDEDTSF